MNRRCGTCRYSRNISIYPAHLKCTSKGKTYWTKVKKYYDFLVPADGDKCSEWRSK